MPTPGEDTRKCETRYVETQRPKVRALTPCLIVGFRPITLALPLLLSLGCLASRTVAQAMPGQTAPPPAATAQPEQTQPEQKPAVKPTQKPNPDEFPANPLEITTPDPLLPLKTDQRPLSELERKQLAIALDGLHSQATAKLKQGDRVGAFDLWYRELRLRRSLGAIEEVKALGRVGDIAWRENLTPDVRWITKRLDAILAQNQLPTAANHSASDPSPQPSSPRSTLSSGERASRIAVLEALGVAYQQVRLPQTAATTYQQILADAKQRRDEQKVDETLITQGKLHLSRFNYPNAATTYQELATRAKARSDRPNEIIYLTQLAYVHEQAKQPAQAIKDQQQLVALYEKLPDPKPIPALKIKIADNYQLLARPDQAEQNYQSAYQLAQPTLQFAHASEALQKLGALYRANDRLDAALKVFEYLVSLEQQSYNYYGMMNAYDQIGQIQLARNQNQQALAAFQQGLGLAKQLKYRQDYFTTQIQKIGK